MYFQLTTNAEGTFEDAMGAANERLVAIAEADPVAMRAEVAHYEAFREHALRALGAEDPASLSLATNLAAGYRDLGRYEEAVRLDEESLEIRSGEHRAEHQSTKVIR